MRYLCLTIAYATMIGSATAASAGPLDPIAGIIKEMKGYCASERISANVTPTPLAPSVDGAIVKLTSSQGLCFGQVGENDYLVARRPGGPWRLLLRGEPGLISVDPAAGGWSHISVQSIGQCQFGYEWNGRAYVVKTSRGCQGLMHPPSLFELARMVNGI